MKEEKPEYFECGICHNIVPYNDELTCLNCLPSIEENEQNGVE